MAMAMKMDSFTVPINRSYVPMQAKPSSVTAADRQTHRRAGRSCRLLAQNVSTANPAMNIAARLSSTDVAADGSNPRLAANVTGVNSKRRAKKTNKTAVAQQRDL